MIKSKRYSHLREKVRLVKSKSGLKYQTEKNSEDNSDNNQDLSLFYENFSVFQPHAKRVFGRVPRTRLHRAVEAVAV